MDQPLDHTPQQEIAAETQTKAWQVLSRRPEAGAERFSGLLDRRNELFLVCTLFCFILASHVPLAGFEI